ncbi:AAA family ATPase [Burkholderia gladioli pv. alliicola]|uniref:AAA family ATPase n=1 Tax=Burkholderia gladioli TaxID=28095 RepID=UPI003D81A964
MTPIQKLIAAVEKQFNSQEFDKFVHDVTFPKFKSFAPGTRIEFRFPITVVVGPNGGGKSSLLHAAWGMPLKHSTSRFWFSTPVDPIDNNGKNRNRYWYSHYIKSIRKIVESRKISGNKRHGYWEPSRPAQREGMQGMPEKTAAFEPFMSSTGDRWSPVERTAHYFNAKEQSSAFDRFFTSVPFDSLENRQDYFIKYSKKLKIVIDDDLKSSVYYNVERVAENVLLTPPQLSAVNNILQKNYKSARYIRHKFYDKATYSPSVLFETEARSYSECFAGSGELAVVNYVLALEGLKKYDLLLLDEPETSLHPGAQQKLIEHLLGIVNEKLVQVIISSHSPTFVQLLPPEALVVLEETADGVAPRPGPTKASAFERLGAIEKDKITILTEDKLLEVLTSRAIRSWPKSLRDRVNVIAVDVGVSEMLSHQARAHLQANSAVIMVLDGDQKPVEKIFSRDPSEMTDREKRDAIENLKKLHVRMVGSNAASPATEITHFEQWMRWCKKHVTLIDKVSAEQVFLELLSPSHALLSEPKATNAQFKEAVKFHLRKDGGKSSAEAQYQVFNFLLGDVPDDSSLKEFLSGFANNLKQIVEQMFAAAQV